MPLFQGEYMNFTMGNTGMKRLLDFRLFFFMMICLVVLSPVRTQALAPLSGSELNTSTQEASMPEVQEKTESKVMKKEGAIKIIHEKDKDSLKDGPDSNILIIHDKKE